MTYYCHFEDLVDGFTGPFTSTEDCDAHAKWVAENTPPGTVYHGAVTQEQMREITPVGFEPFTMTPEEDREFMLVEYGPDSKWAKENKQ
jgi:hypothetical protein